MNALTFKVTTGTFGELFVQFRLLQCAVQAAAPIKDSGNDLIAVRGKTFRAISVRSTCGKKFNRPKAHREYHILAVVHFKRDADSALILDESKLFLIPREKVWTIPNRIDAIGEFAFSPEHVDSFFPPAA